MAKLAAAATLCLRFALAVPAAGVQTLLLVFSGRRRPAAGFVRLRFAPMSELGASLLACLVTLTPGSTAIDVDLEKRELLVHLLDVSDPARAAAGIRRNFERPLQVLFGRAEGR